MSTDTQSASAVAAAAVASAVAKAIAETIVSERALNRLDQLDRRLDNLERAHVRSIEKLNGLDLAATRWKGGFLVLVALGAFTTWLFSIGASIKAVFK